LSNYTKSTNFATKDNLSPGNPLKIVKGAEIDTEFNNIQTAVATKTDNASANITGGSITGITDLAIADGGTGASTATAAINNLLPSQTSNANKYLQTDGTNVSWDAVSLSTADITGTLPVANGGTGVTSSTGTGSVVLSNSPTLVTPALGTPASGTATNLTGLPISTGVSGLGTGVATFLGTPSSANLASAITDETGSGALVFANSPTLVTPALGTPASGVLTNATGLPISTGVSGLGTGVATFLATPSSANLASAVSDETGTGALVFANSPTLVTPALGTPASGVATNLTGLPLSTGVTGTLPVLNGGTGVTTSTGSGNNVLSTSPTLVTPILGTPTSATLTNATGLPLSTGVTGTLPVANGGTGTATPSIVAGTNVTVTGTWPNQTIAASGGGGGTPGGSTTQVQYNNAGAFGGITGATTDGTALTLVAPVLGTPASATLTNATGLPLSTGVTGTLPVLNGGTGETSYTNGQLLIGNTTGNTLTKATLTAGSGVTITNGSGAITIAASGSAATATTVSDTANTSTGYFQIPQGTTAQRPASPANGMTRINTTTNSYEVYSSFTSGWVSLYTFSINVNYLVVAGGGSGGGNLDVGTYVGSGGGGAGGMKTGSSALGTSFTVTVGAGGAGSPNIQGASGSNSVFSSITSTGGGAGGSQPSSGTTYVTGLSGGSGGGGGSTSALNPGPGGSATPSGEGNAGGAGTYTASAYGGGGGGGAGAVGANGTSSAGGDGGSGTASSISGSSVTYAGGGGGGTYTSGTLGLGGSGGGGDAARGGTSNNGTANLGGGGGGNSGASGTRAGGNGGSGVVIISYPSTSPDLTSIGAGLTYAKTTSGGNTIYTFTAGTGTVTV
jgi:hypothetical protein